MADVTSTQVSIPRVAVSPRSGRSKPVSPPEVHAVLASSRAKFVQLASSAPISRRGQTMDGVPEITVRQFQRVTLLAYVENVDRTAITQSTVASVHNGIFRMSTDGGAPVGEFFSTPSDVVYDTIQYDAKDQDGYNLAVEFEFADDETSQGGSTYQFESIVELTSGEHIPVLGRVIVQPTFLLPLNEY